MPARPPDRPTGRFSRLPLIGAVTANPAFRNADFRRLLAGAACNAFGMSGEHVILGLLVFRITGSTAWVGVTIALYNLPMLIFGVLSGVAADWLDRRTLLRVIELAIAVNLGFFAIVIGTGWGDLWPIMAFTVITGSLRAMTQPVRISYTYDIVGGEHIVAGLGLLNLGARLGQLAGALAAGVAMERFGTPAALLVLGVVHGLAFVIFTLLRSAGESAPMERAPIAQNLREYISEMRGNRTLMMLVVVTAAVEVFGFSFSTALPELATNRFGVGAEGLGVMHAARAAGGALAGLVLAGTGTLQRRGAIYLAVIYAFGASLLLLAASGTFMLGLAALVAVAVLATTSDVLTQSMMQLSVPNRLRGRAMGAWVFAIGSAPLGHLEMGALAVSLGVGSALVINGAALIGVGVLATIVVPRLRRL